MLKNVDCRNFDCAMNDKGHCKSNRITLEPVGGIIDRLKCTEAERRIELAGTDREYTHF